jgi:hypothetical protein
MCMCVCSFHVLCDKTFFEAAERIGVRAARSFLLFRAALNLQAAHKAPLCLRRGFPSEHAVTRQLLKVLEQESSPVSN